MFSLENRYERQATTKQPVHFTYRLHVKVFFAGKTATSEPHCLRRREIAAGATVESKEKAAAAFRPAAATTFATGRMVLVPQRYDT